MLKITKTKFGSLEIIQRQHWCEYCNKPTPAWQEDLFLDEEKKVNIGINTKCLCCFKITSNGIIGYKR